MIDNKTKHNFPRLYRWEGGRHAREGDWDVCSPKTVRNFSGIGYIFARRLHMAAKIPIGVIDASRWGTTVEAWTPLSVLKKIKAESVQSWLASWDKKAAEWDPQKDLESRIKRYNKRMDALEKQGQDVLRKPPNEVRPGPAHNQNYPGNCYASMIAPLAGFPVKGAIYHQGFNNSRIDAADFYYRVFPKMITAWRAAFNNADMAFGIISLCTDGTPQTLDNYTECMIDLGIYVREAQYKTFLDFYKAGDRNIGFASSFDLRRAWYHPQLKIPVGERIARWALSTQYGFKGRMYWKPPMLTKMEVKDGTILLHVDEDVASVDSRAISGFAIAGKDKKFQPATAECLVIGKDDRGRSKYNRKIVVLSSPHVPEPIHFRYAWGRNPMGNLQIAHTNQKDILFATQRSDDWGFWEVPFLEPPADKGASKASRAKLREALRLVDLERRVKNAERFLKQNMPHYKEALKKMQSH